jgi:hypothetical protein
MNVGCACDEHWAAQFVCCWSSWKAFSMLGLQGCGSVALLAMSTISVRIGDGAGAVSFYLMMLNHRRLAPMSEGKHSTQRTTNARRHRSQ